LKVTNNYSCKQLIVQNLHRKKEFGISVLSNLAALNCKIINTMKKIMFFVFLAVMALSACKSTKKQPQVKYTPPEAQPKVFTVPETTETAKPVTGDQSVSLRKESVTFTEAGDKSSNEANSLFVILGSFGQLDNAKNFRETLLNEGFSPIILHSETGYYRVCVNSYKSEAEARRRVTEIRQAFPKYSDLWLLIKQ